MGLLYDALSILVQNKQIVELGVDLVGLRTGAKARCKLGRAPVGELGCQRRKKWNREDRDIPSTCLSK